MSNMSYCRFENTSNDLRDCVTTMEESYDLDELDLSKSEQSAMRHMKDLCERFLESYEDLVSRSSVDAAAE